ncbi:uncharacterized protein AMSG_01920 [Thecamonas trahens ATCC 50062]|uniref:FERM central domain-containing protein n=1 Tax=Thecamonas trahens ATCC 50062 TaxID=461836 RepID=A0A0L0DUC6_THETB|nr:hypothetical protein AMSG_01920 [Thecamonas trahens ATCC 50062]KNC55651.1 hypothetical protein AMSG_01920 [Thecamonas trahens ATCC 50062]|eukprot:XP_013761421.1 hypothetical protein AMSG_01920 [Thecamonas trahens ATCC 50062]
MADKLGLTRAGARLFDIFPSIGGYDRKPRSHITQQGEHLESAKKHEASLVLHTVQRFDKYESHMLAAKHKHAIKHSRLARHAYLHYMPIRSDEEAIRLSALALQAAFGSFDPHVHRIGFLNRTHILTDYVPAFLVVDAVETSASAAATVLNIPHAGAARSPKSKPGAADTPLTRRSADEWERLILAQLQLEPPRSTGLATLAFLTTIRRSEYYGAMYFMPSKVETSLHGLLPHRIMICISPSRIYFVDHTSRTRIAKYHFKELRHWGGEHSHTKWLVTILKAEEARLLRSGSHAILGNARLIPRQPSSPDEPEPAVSDETYVFHTPQGLFISTALFKAIHEHIRDQHMRTASRRSGPPVRRHQAPPTLANPLYSPSADVQAFATTASPDSTAARNPVDTAGRRRHHHAGLGFGPRPLLLARLVVFGLHLLVLLGHRLL